jgi:hypothetical protein
VLELPSRVQVASPQLHVAAALAVDASRHGDREKGVAAIKSRGGTWLSARFADVSEGSGRDYSRRALLISLESHKSRSNTRERCMPKYLENTTARRHILACTNDTQSRLEKKKLYLSLAPVQVPEQGEMDGLWEVRQGESVCVKNLESS